MIEIKKEGIVLSKTAEKFENEGVLNPAAIKVGDTIHMFYRAVHEGNYSSIGYCNFSSPLVLRERWTKPLMEADGEMEKHGIEDPRITKIDDLYYLTYTAYDGINAHGCLAVSEDLVHFEKKGPIVPLIKYKDFKRLAEGRTKLNDKYARYNKNAVLLWDKNVIFFPKRINGKLHFLHRIRPDIQLVSVYELEELTAEFWENYFINFQEKIVMTSKYRHEHSYIGGGCPPIETPEGWLLIYHGVHDSIKGYVYSACAALLDLNNPQQEIARLPHALFKPEYEWELKGEVNNVCFPTGAVVEGDTLYLYYGAADERIACASLSIKSLISELLLNKTKF